MAVTEVETNEARIALSLSDRCPFHRPFPEDFADCPTFQPVAFMAADSMGQRLSSVVTCRHLTTGTSTERGRFYPRCALGNPGDRLRWLSQVSPVRLEAVRALQQEFDDVTGSYRERLFDARAKLKAASGDPGPRGQLDSLLAEFREVIGRFLTQHEARFRDLGLPIGPLRDLIEDWSQAWLKSWELGAARLSEDRLGAFDPPTQAVLGGLAVSPWRRPPSEATIQHPIYLDKVLEVVRTVDPPGVALSGDIDASNVDRVAQVLLNAAQRGDDLHVDLHGLIFSDIGGLRALVRAAQELPNGRRLVLHGTPPHVQRALAMVGWASLPNLVTAS